MAKKRILVVEDDSDIAKMMVRILGKMEYTVVSVVATGESAIQTAIKEKPDLVLMDMILAGAMNGLEAGKKIRELIKVPILYLTGYAEKIDFLQTEGCAALLKPFQHEDLRTAIEVALYKADMEKKE